MIVVISGASHTGKTFLAQKILEKYGYPYLSIDHLKMGLIRSGQTTLTPESPDDRLTAWLWPTVREIIKTAIENKQNLTVEGCYVPFCWKNDFDAKYLERIRYACLVMSRGYIATYWSDIVKYADVIEKRQGDSEVCRENLEKENAFFMENCLKNRLNFILIDKSYPTDIGLERFR